MAAHRCWRSYPSGRRSELLVLDDAQVAEWRAHNELWRFGCAQFVDGRCVYRGYLTEDAVKAIERAAGVAATAPTTTGTP